MDQLIVSDLGKLHLEVVLERLRRESGVPFRHDNPQIIFMETVREAASGEGVAGCVLNASSNAESSPAYR